MAEVEYIGEEKLRERMLGDKFVCGVLGVELVEVGKGTARAELTVRPEHMNGVGICQGGVLFTIADYALAAASNYGPDPTVAIDVSISFCKSIKSGKLIAKAREIARSRTTSVSNVEVFDESGTLLCAARGRGYILQPRG